MAITPKPDRTLALGLERLLALVDETGASANVSARAHEQARGQALQLFEACDGSRDALPLVLLGYAADLLRLIAVDLAAHPPEAERLISQIVRAGVPRVALGREVLRTGRLLELPVAVAVEVQLWLLLTFTEARSVSLWTSASGGELKLVSHAGEPVAGSAAARGVAQALFAGPEPANADGSTVGLRIERVDLAPAALVAGSIDPAAAGPALMLSAAAPTLAALLDREALLAREQSAQETVVSSVQRRLARLRFDLHDGPQQDVHLLAQDLGLFREQLRPMIAGDPNADRLTGRLDDLEAQLVALDGDLRRLSTSVQSPFLAPGSLPDALAQLTHDFAARTGVRPQTSFRGRLAHLTDSQQITLLALVREALSNIRKHSDAGTVTITIASDQRGVRVQISDDGSGFDPQTTLVRAARAGHLGLVGMHERVRMLGGRTQIDSRPGGPTVISATLPPWPPEPSV